MSKRMSAFLPAILLLSSHAYLNSMDPTNSCQLEIALLRKAYNEKIRNNSPKNTTSSQTTQQRCVFCDKKILKQNYIITEDTERGVRVMLNKFPYFSFDQGKHLLIMPISHEEHPKNLAKSILNNVTDEAHKVAIILHSNAYTQEYFANWGKLAGQSVPHWHSQVKVFEQKPASLPQRMALQKNSKIKTIEQAFDNTKKIFKAYNASDTITQEKKTQRKEMHLLHSEERKSPG